MRSISSAEYLRRAGPRARRRTVGDRQEQRGAAPGEAVDIAHERECGVVDARELGHELAEQRGAPQENEPRHRVGHRQQLVEFVANALARDDGEAIAQCSDGRLGLGFGHQRVAGHEARRAQHAQRVVAQGHFRREWRAQHARTEVVPAIERIDEHSVG